MSKRQTACTLLAILGFTITTTIIVFTAVTQWWKYGTLTTGTGIALGLVIGFMLCMLVLVAISRGK